MYCETCQADVAAEISADGKSLLCTTCGSDVRRTSAPTLSSEAQSARDLLERWSRDELLDPYGPVDPDAARDTSASEHAGSGRPGNERGSGDAADSVDPEEMPPDPSIPRQAPPRPKGKIRVDHASSGPPMPASRRRDRPSRPASQHDADAAEASQPPSSQPSSSQQPGQPPQQPARPQPRASSQPNFRIDAQHATDAFMSANIGAESGSGTPIPPPHKPPAAKLPDGYRLDAAEEAHVPAPHFATDPFIVPTGPKPGRFESLAGQLLAYGGVALLTVGTALVLYGYFGGGGQTTATGWLIATIGQMLLFLGVVTLISGGMQQTTHEVGSRVQYLGERLVRLESSSREPLAGPHFQRVRSRSDAAVAAGEVEEEL